MDKLDSGGATTKARANNKSYPQDDLIQQGLKIDESKREITEKLREATREQYKKIVPWRVRNDAKGRSEASIQTSAAFAERVAGSFGKQLRKDTIDIMVNT